MVKFGPRAAVGGEMSSLFKLRLRVLLQKGALINVFTLRKRVRLFMFSHFTPHTTRGRFVFVRKKPKKSVQFALCKWTNSRVSKWALLFLPKSIWSQFRCPKSVINVYSTHPPPPPSLLRFAPKQGRGGGGVLLLGISLTAKNTKSPDELTTDSWASDMTF